MRDGLELRGSCVASSWPRPACSRPAPRRRRRRSRARPQTVASGLSFPWEVLPMPDGRLLVTERPGRVRVIDAGGNLLPQPAYTSLGGKFLGLAIHPNYATNKFVYLYNTYSDAGRLQEPDPAVRRQRNHADVLGDDPRRNPRRPDEQRPRRGADQVRAGRQAVRDHRRHLRARPPAGPRVARRQDPAAERSGRRHRTAPPRPTTRSHRGRTRSSSGAMATATRRGSPGTPRVSCGRPSTAPAGRPTPAGAVAATS